MLLGRIGADVVVTHKAGADDPAPPGGPGADWTSFAVLTGDAAGLVKRWPKSVRDGRGPRPWTSNSPAESLATMHCEPAPGGSPAGPGGALVIIQCAPASPARPGPDLLSETATRIGHA